MSSARPLEAGRGTSGLAWGRLGRLVLLSRDLRTCRAQHIPRMTRVRVASSRRLGIKRAAVNVRLARSTRHVSGKDVVSSQFGQHESFVCRDGLSRQVLARIHEVHMAPVFATRTTSHPCPRMGRSVPLP